MGGKLTYSFRSGVFNSDSSYFDLFIYGLKVDFLSVWHINMLVYQLFSVQSHTRIFTDFRGFSRFPEKDNYHVRMLPTAIKFDSVTTGATLARNLSDS